MIETDVLEIITRDDERAGEHLNALVDEFRSGRDVADLARFLDAESAEVVSIGAWILGELTFDIYNTDRFIRRLYSLLEHSDPGVRFYALGAIFPALDAHDPRCRALLEKLRGDTNEGVRISAEAAAKRLGLE
jgi:hypothetical protein